MQGGLRLSDFLGLLGELTVRLDKKAWLIYPT